MNTITRGERDFLSFLTFVALLLAVSVFALLVPAHFIGKTSCAQYSADSKHATRYAGMHCFVELEGVYYIHGANAATR